MDGKGVVLNITIEPMPSLFLYMYYIYIYIYTFHQRTRGLEGRWCPRKNRVSIPVPVLVVKPREASYVPKNSPAISQVSERLDIDMIFHMGVSKNGVPPKRPKMIIFSRKTHGCWGNPPYLGTSILFQFTQEMFAIGASGCFWWDVFLNSLIGFSSDPVSHGVTPPRILWRIAPFSREAQFRAGLKDWWFSGEICRCLRMKNRKFLQDLWDIWLLCMFFLKHLSTPLSDDFYLNYSTAVWIGSSLWSHWIHFNTLHRASPKSFWVFC